MSKTIIYGPPGTGKTTKLLSLMEEHLDTQSAREILFTSFTRKSIDEATHRVEKKFRTVDEDLPYFKTIHSLSMRLSGVKKTDILQFRHKIEIARELGVEITTKRTMDGTSYGMKDGDKLFHLSDYYRSKMITPEKAWAELGREVDYAIVDRFLRTYKMYKSSELLLDFTDMLTNYIENGKVPRVKLMFVDEAQDLTPLQWKVIEKMAGGADKIYIAGDDDQGIYGWNGADVDKFIGLKGERIVLEKSYRLNEKVYNISNRIIRKVSKRVEKNFSPSKEGGLARRVATLYALPILKGDWLLLARNGFMLKQYEDFCIEQGVMFDSAGYGPSKWPELKALVNYERWRKGMEVPDEAVEQINKFSSRSLVDRDRNNFLPWFEHFDLFDHTISEYFRRCKRNDEKILGKPRIKINTIHGAKGGEAENVCILTDLANTTWKAMEENPDEEHRVFYVGVTRAIDNLYLLEPLTNKSYWI